MFVFAGKAAPGYHMAKLIFKLIHAVAEVVNRDPLTNTRLRVVFVPDMNVRTGQWLYPAAVVPEQISLAGKEASGTGNMKFSMNGALTLGTLDGATVEIREAVGAENFFLFGLRVDGVADRMARGYRPGEYIERDEKLRDALDLIASGLFSHGDGELFRPLLDNLRGQDPHLVCADFRAYLTADAMVDTQFRDGESWQRMSILNVARIGRFSSDRAIREYGRDIGKTGPVSVD